MQPVNRIAHLFGAPAAPEPAEAFEASEAWRPEADVIGELERRLATAGRAAKMAARRVQATAPDERSGQLELLRHIQELLSLNGKLLEMLGVGAELITAFREKMP